jgi:heat shock protein HspQ|tara:strand:- start:166 stop:339 length:174 start_codon:yes stop_codon:yes gene_type:complete
VELNVGDLVQHNVHGFYGIVISQTGFWGQALVCKVEWAHTQKINIIDILFLDKVSDK